MINKMKKTRELMSIYLAPNKISIKARKLSFQLQKDNNKTVKTNNPQFE